jgi:hypothetical protein
MGLNAVLLYKVAYPSSKMGGDEIKARKLCFNQDRTENVSIFVCMPHPEEHCPITSELIGSSAYTPPYCQGSADSDNDKRSVDGETQRCKKKRLSSPRQPAHCFSEFPSLSCAEMICGHRFDLRALLIHFMRNTMNCPMCRGGKSNIALSCKTSFPHEKWMCEAEERIQSELRREEDAQRSEDARLAGHLQSSYYHHILPSLVLNSLQDHVVNASLFFYDAPTSGSVMFPIHGMQFEMELMPLEIHHRDLPRGISLYTSFSSNSIATPTAHDNNNNTDHNDNNTAAASRANENIIRDNNSISNHSAADLNNDDHSLSSTLGGGGGRTFSLDDITVRYTMTDSNLRYHYYSFQ